MGNEGVAIPLPEAIGPSRLLPPAFQLGQEAGPEEVLMRASVGDRIVVRGHKVGEHERDGEILEVRGDDGAPPYVVRWVRDGHESTFYPGTDAVIEHYENQR